MCDQIQYWNRTHVNLTIDRLTININHPHAHGPLPNIQYNTTLPSKFGWTDDQALQDYGSVTEIKELAIYQTGTRGVRLDIVEPHGRCGKGSVHLSCYGSHRNHNTKVLLKAQSIWVKEIHVRFHFLTHEDSTPESRAKFMAVALVPPLRPGARSGPRHPFRVIVVDSVTIVGPGESGGPVKKVVKGPTTSYYINCDQSSPSLSLPGVRDNASSVRTDLLKAAILDLTQSLSCSKTKTSGGNNALVAASTATTISSDKRAHEQPKSSTIDSNQGAGQDVTLPAPLKTYASAAALLSKSSVQPCIPPSQPSSSKEHPRTTKDNDHMDGFNSLASEDAANTPSKMKKKNKQSKKRNAEKCKVDPAISLLLETPSSQPSMSDEGSQTSKGNYHMKDSDIIASSAVSDTSNYAKRKNKSAKKKKAEKYKVVPATAPFLGIPVQPCVPSTRPSPSKEQPETTRGNDHAIDSDNQASSAVTDTSEEIEKANKCEVTPAIALGCNSHILPKVPGQEIHFKHCALRNIDSLDASLRPNRYSEPNQVSYVNSVILHLQAQIDERLEPALSLVPIIRYCQPVSRSNSPSTCPRAVSLPSSQTESYDVVNTHLHRALSAHEPSNELGLLKQTDAKKLRLNVSPCGENAASPTRISVEETDTLGIGCSLENVTPQYDGESALEIFIGPRSDDFKLKDVPLHVRGDISGLQRLIDLSSQIDDLPRITAPRPMREVNTKVLERLASPDIGEETQNPDCELTGTRDALRKCQSLPSSPEHSSSREAALFESRRVRHVTPSSMAKCNAVIPVDLASFVEGQGSSAEQSLSMKGPPSSVEDSAS